MLRNGMRTCWTNQLLWSCGNVLYSLIYSTSGCSKINKMSFHEFMGWDSLFVGCSAMTFFIELFLQLKIFYFFCTTGAVNTLFFKVKISFLYEMLFRAPIGAAVQPKNIDTWMISFFSCLYPSCKDIFSLLL